MSGKRTLIAICAASALGSLGTASVAQAGNQGEDRGGFVMPGSMDGVNPVYHPEWFGKGASTRNVAPADDAFGYAVPSIRKHRPAQERTRDR